MGGVFMKRWILFTIAILLAVTATAAALQREQKLLSEKVTRLHVVANSDTEEDQAVKLQIRDAVLAVTEGMDRAQLQAAIGQIQHAAEDCLVSLGRSEPVSVTYCQERFPTRTYETFALPAGVYQTLRVTIGDGAGQNWWCVAFPSICFCATSEALEEAAVSAGFTKQEIKMITGEGYVLKFKLVECLEKWKAKYFT